MEYAMLGQSSDEEMALLLFLFLSLTGGARMYFVALSELG